MNLLEIGKILRPHGILGAVKVESYVDQPFSSFKNVFITEKRAKAIVKSVKNLNNNFYIVNFDVIHNIDTAEKFRNQSIYIDRDEYAEFKDKVYMSDLINKPVINEKGENIGYMVDFDDYGASMVLTIKCGFNTYQIPYVNEIIEYNTEIEAFIVNEKTFNDVKI